MTIEAMKQALEALNTGNNEVLPEDYGQMVSEAITALRAAIEETEKQEPVATVVARQYEDGTYAGNALDWAGRNCEDDLPVGTKLYTSQHPKQEQEPFCYHDGRNIVGKEYADHSDVFPLYTAPRQWQGLTDEEIYDCLQERNREKPSKLVRMIAKAIEEKLKEKNG